MPFRALSSDVVLQIISHSDTISLLRLASACIFLRRLVNDLIQRNIVKIQSDSPLSLSLLPLPSSSPTEGKDLLQPIILISCGDHCFLFNIRLQTFEPWAMMRQPRFTRFYYSIHSLPSREVLCFSSPSFSATWSSEYSLETYSHLTKEWTSFPLNSSFKLPHLAGFSAAYSPGHKVLYISGGYNTETAMPSPFLYMYDLSRQTVLPGNHHLRLARDGHASILFRDMLLVAGGYAGGGQYQFGRGLPHTHTAIRELSEYVQGALLVHVASDRLRRTASCGRRRGRDD